MRKKIIDWATLGLLITVIAAAVSLISLASRHKSRAIGSNIIEQEFTPTDESPPARRDDIQFGMSPSLNLHSSR